MLTPQEVQDKKFPKSLFSGYDMGEVDDFLDTLSADYAALYKENVVLKNKLKVLAEKIEEYRSVDAAMRKALLAAQKMAAEITEDAKKKSDELRRKAQIDYENTLGALKDSIRNEERRLEKLREETSRFAEASIMLYQRQIETLKRMITEPGINKPNPVDQTAEIIEKNVKMAISEEIAETTDETTEAAGTVPVSGQQAEVPDPDRADMDSGTLVEAVPDIMSDSISIGQEIVRDVPFDEKHFETLASDGSDFGYNNYDLSKLFSADNTNGEAEPGSPADTDTNRDTSGKDQRRPREVNAGGMSVRVFELDLDSGKRDDSSIL